MMYQYLMIKNFLNNLVKNEEGQGMAEYGLILALIAVAVITAVTLLGTNLDLQFTDVAGELAP